jgi:hypothetical protein
MAIMEEKIELIKQSLATDDIAIIKSIKSILGITLSWVKRF